MNAHAELVIRALEARKEIRAAVPYELGPLIVEHNAKIDATIQWVREVERDAERYRHLRKAVDRQIVRGLYPFRDAAQMETTIDAAIREQT